MNIYDLISRAQKLRKETQLDSVSPDRVGGLHEDTLKYINEFQLLASSPSLHKIYASVSAMQSDKSPKSDLTGKPLKPGQLVVIVPANQTDATAGDVYRYDGPSGNTSAWTFVAKIGAVPADAELSATSTNPPQNKVVTEKLTELESETKNTLGDYISNNSEYIRAYTDAEGKFLWGIRIDGSIEWAKGIPNPIKEYMYDLLQNKVDKEIDKSLIDVRLIKSVNHDEFVWVLQDDKGHILFAIRKDGSIYNNDINDRLSELDKANKKRGLFFNNHGLSPLFQPTAPKPLMYEINTFVQNAVSYPDGTLFYGDISGNGITRILPNGTKGKILTLNGADGGFRCLWLDKDYNLYASPKVNAANAEVGGLYRLPYKGDTFEKVLSLYDPNSSVESETIASNAVIWTMTQDNKGYIYAGVYVLSHSKPLIYRSTDNGISWGIISDMSKYAPNGIHIHVIQYNPYDNALYCIVGEVNTIFKSIDHGVTWENLRISLEYMKGTSMLCVQDGLIIGSDYAYWGMMYKVYADGSFRTTAKWWANAVFAIRQSDVTGWLYAFGVIDSAVSNRGYYPPTDALNDNSVLQTWLESNPKNKKQWQDYHYSMRGLYDEDSIIPQHSSVMISKDNGETWEVLCRIKGKSSGEPSQFRNGECAISYYDSSYHTIVISEGNHRYTGSGVDCKDEIFVKIASLDYVQPLI